MTTTPPKPRAAVSPPAWPGAKVWTCDEFHALGDQGFFANRRPVLIRGTIVELGPMNPPHAVAVELIQDLLRTVFGVGWRVRTQLPLVLSQVTDPQPDFAVLPGSARTASGHPTAAALVIEVADSSLRMDLGEKMELYAAGGITDYWVVDVNAGELVVHRDPDPAAEQYRTVFRLRPADSVAPLAAPTSPVLVSELLP